MVSWFRKHIKAYYRVLKFAVLEINLTMLAFYFLYEKAAKNDCSHKIPNHNVNYNVIKLIFENSATSFCIVDSSFIA